MQNHLKSQQICKQAPRAEHSPARVPLLNIPLELFVCTIIYCYKLSGLQLCSPWG